MLRWAVLQGLERWLSVLEKLLVETRGNIGANRSDV